MNTHRWLTLTLALVLVHFCTLRHVDPDLWGHVLYGEATLASGLQRVDPYSYAQDPPAAWHNHEWLAEAILALVYRGLGAAGLLLVQGLLGSAAGLIGLWMVRDRGRELLESTVVVLLCAVSMAPGMQSRPQVFTYFFFAVLLGILHLRKHHGRDWTPAIPPLLALWVNCHGGFLAGLGVFALFEIAEAGEACLRREWGKFGARAVLKRGAVLACAGLAPLANPYGAEIFPMLQRSVTSIRHTITEWDALGLRPEHAAPIALIAVVAIAWILSRRDKHLYQLAMLGVTAFLAVRHVRHTPFLALAAMACLPEHLESAVRPRFLAAFDPATAPARLRRLYAASFALCCAILLAKTAGLHLDRPLGLGSDPGEYPPQAVRFMKQHQVRGNLLAFFDWAQYAMWHLAPDVKIFFDGRFRTVYSPEIEDDYLSFQNQVPDHWRRALNAYATEWVLVPVDLPVEDALAKEPGWTLVYRDAVAALYGKAGAPRVQPFLAGAPTVDRTAAARAEVTWFP